MRYWARLRKQPVVVSGSSSRPKMADGREEKDWGGGGGLSLITFREPRLLAICPGLTPTPEEGPRWEGEPPGCTGEAAIACSSPAAPLCCPGTHTGGAALFCFLPESPVLLQLMEEGTGKGTGPAGRGGNGVGEGWNRVSKRVRGKTL